MQRIDSASSTDRLRLACMGLALLTLVLYSPVYFHDFILLDDVLYISGNEIVQRGLTWEGMKWAFTTSDTGGFWLPMTWLSHMLDCQLFGLNPGAHHVVNVLFHAANAVLLLLIWHRMTGAFWISVFIAAAFAWHPLRVESVAWAAERKDVLSMFFGLAALGCYVRFAIRKNESGTGDMRAYWFAIFLFALSLMSKAMWITFPFVLLLLDYWPLQRMNGSRDGAKGSRDNSTLLRLVIEKWPFFLLTAAFSVVTFVTQKTDLAVVPLEVLPVHLRLSNALVSYVQYLAKTFWPMNLAPFYPFPTAVPRWQSAAAAVALFAASLAVWRARRQRRYLFAGWFWFIGTLVPMIGLAQVGIQGMADRFTYLSSIGIYAILAHGTPDVVARFQINRRFAPAVAALALAACAVLTVRQLGFWADSETLFKRTVAVTKDNFVAHATLGMAYNRQGKTSEALTEFTKALSIQKNAVAQVPHLTQQSFSVHLLLAAALEREERYDEALNQYQEALQIRPADAQALNGLGKLLTSMNRLDEAETTLREAMRLNPNDSLAYENLGQLFLKGGRFDDAVREYGSAARLNPQDARPHYLMAKAELRRGNAARAIGHFRTALARNSNDIQSLTLLARLLASDSRDENRNGSEAVVLAERANSLAEGRDTFVLDTLAMACAEANRFNDAQQVIQTAINMARESGHNEDAAQMLQRLRLYRSGQPYREAAGSSPNEEDSR